MTTQNIFNIAVKELDYIIGVYLEIGIPVKCASEKIQSRDYIEEIEFAYTELVKDIPCQTTTL